jgi:putative MATE family efflux protein
MNWPRLVRLYLQIGAVSSASLWVFGQLFSEPEFTIAAAAVAIIAFVSVVLVGFVAVSLSLYVVFQTAWKRVLGLAWPVIVEQTSRTLMRTTDVFVTALFSPAAVVAIGLSSLYAQIPLWIGLGLGSGSIALSSQETGRGSAANRDEATTQALLVGLVLGVPIAVVGVLFGAQLIALLGATPTVVEMGGQYLAIILATAPARHVQLIGANVLQGIGDTKTPMYINLFANALNIGGSVVLGVGLFGLPALRVVGVGLSTAAANVVAALLFVVVIVGPWGDAGVTRPSDHTIGRQLLVVSVPRTAEGLVVTVARFPFNALLLTFGTNVNAGYQIGTRVFQQVTAPLGRAYRVTASITTGQALGADDPDQARFGGWAILALGVLSVGTIGVVLVAAAEPLARLFTDDPQTVAEAVGFVRAYGIAATPYVVFIVLSGALQGASETRLPFLARATGMFGFFVGGTYVLGVTLGYGSLGATVGIVLSYVWMAVVGLWSFTRSDWAVRAARMMRERSTSEP